jgi:acyl-CoA dehydrogenase
LEVEADIGTVLEGLRAFVEAEVFPRHETHGAWLDDPLRRFGPGGRESGQVRELRSEVRRAAAKAGYYQMTVPSSLGGGGLSPIGIYRVWEALHHWCGMRAWLAYDAVAHWVTGPSDLCRHLSPALQDSLLPDLLSGEKTWCFAMSEPDAGTDLWRMSTRATRTGGTWRITGTKQWITNGPDADLAMVFAVTDPERARARSGGLTVFVIDMHAAGAAVDSVIRIFGEPGGREAILSFSDVEVNDAAVLGAVDEGLPLALRGIQNGRLFNAAKAVGLARWAWEQAVDYARQRVTFGVPLIEHQSIAFRLAEAYSDISAARLIGLEAAAKLAGGEPAVKELAAAKYVSTETAGRVIDLAMQVHGGMGLTNELGLAAAWHEVRVVQIADGSAEMMRRIISRRLAQGDVDVMGM